MVLVALMLTKLPKRFSPINQVKCPFCSNENLLLLVEFDKKWEGSKNNIGYCVKKVTKNVMGLISIKGCGRKFNLEILPRKEVVFPPL